MKNFEGLVGEELAALREPLLPKDSELPSNSSMQGAMHDQLEKLATKIVAGLSKNNSTLFNAAGSHMNEIEKLLKFYKSNAANEVVMRESNALISRLSVMLDNAENRVSVSAKC